MGGKLKQQNPEKWTTQNVAEDVEQREFLHIVDEKLNMVPSEDRLAVSYKTPYALPSCATVTFLVFTQKRSKHGHTKLPHGCYSSFKA